MKFDPKLPITEMNAQTRAYAKEHLRECCQELIELNNTGVLKQGRIREMAAFVTKWADASSALSIVTSLVEFEAVQQVAAQQAQNSTSPATSPADVANIRAQAFRDAGAWFIANDMEGEKYLPAFKLMEMADGTIEPPLSS